MNFREGRRAHGSAEKERLESGWNGEDQAWFVAESTHEVLGVLVLLTAQFWVAA